MLSKEQSHIEYILAMISQLLSIESPSDLNLKLINVFVMSLCNLAGCFQKNEQSEEDLNAFLQELIEPFINILNYLINTDFLKGSNTIELIISNFTSQILDVMDMETYLPHLFPIIENCCKVPDLSDDDPTVFISSLYDELNLNSYLKDDDLRLLSSKLFNKIIDMNPDSKYIIFNAILHDGQDINTENSYLFTYYIQYLISSETKLSDDDMAILTTTYDAILDFPSDENDAFMILAKIALLSVSPYIGREQFTEDIVQSHLEIIQNSIETYLTEKSLDIDSIPKLNLIEVIPTFSLCVFTLYLRYIRNSVQCGFETFINEKVLEFITEYKKISILYSDTLAYSAIAKKIPDEATKYLESILVPLYDSILLMLDDEDICDKEYEVDAEIEQKCHTISDILLSVGKLIDFRPMMEKHLEIIEKLVENDLEIVDFVESLNPLIDFENHLQMMIEYTMRLSDIRNLSACCLSEVLLQISYSICKYPNVFFSPNENGQTLAEIFVSFFMGKLYNEKPKNYELGGEIFVIKSQFNLYDTDYFPFMVIFALVISNKVNFDVSQIINFCLEKINDQNNEDNPVVKRCLSIPILAALSIPDFHIPEEVCVLIYQLFQIYFENENTQPFDQEDTKIGKKFVSEGFSKLSQIFEVESENLMKISNIFNK
ncbi:hypothetical protein TVAG_486640 [Trichomonas vaginalis G3]|uniref:Uncharacterized protein n=1 Tax=Trichomonas vaginalis (strain ATCC PRA-98 / G3) TaxID=412133 RepID=A2DZ92_TRIV3|nr:armadillo (ARM) repeat-containing protein family [Trichomonas vaginalis G3]EAY14221.1 hypothetical protein TVAG_486640 [Trichomonas vaginalis G3]KAI5491829.1 armadillo (ARM) repeat-containing protein family [Trichomonas vaginalis G3]|eukprot:XP_001326444.1 hypothetical protein [Trichomonas vaginalis G3]